MKIMLPLLLLTASLPAAAFGDNIPAINFENSVYLVNRLGRTVWITPNRISADASITSGPAPKCDELKTRIQKLKPALETCSRETSNFCKGIARSIFIMAENRSGSGDPADYTQGKTNAWKVDLRAPIVNQSGLTAAAARFTGVAPGAIRLNLEPRAKLKAIPTMTMSADSLLAQVQSAVQFDELFTWNDHGFVTRNALAACDLLAGKIRFKGEAESSLSSTDLTPDAVLDLAWKSYEAIARAPALDSGKSPLGQIFQAGFYLGSEVPELAKAEDSLLALEEIFGRFFEQRSFGLKLKEFSSKEIMRTQAYPDQTYRTSINHDWSL